MRQGAGILFYHGTGADRELLLVRRAIPPLRGWWGGSGGSMDARDGGDLWRTAIRETAEEFGDHREVRRALERLSGPPVQWETNYPSYRFTTFAVELLVKPELESWPSRDPYLARHNHEWSQKGWFSVRQLPLLRLPSVWRVRSRLGR